jgi:biopolymer transport protein TolQ
VIAYNKFSTDLGRYADRLDAFSSEFTTILSRHLEERG